MVNSKGIKIVLVMVLLLTITACNDVNDDTANLGDSQKIVTNVDKVGEDTGEPIISVVKVDRYENMAITDWLNEDTVVVSKENTLLEKMSLLELSDSHPRSLYLYNIDTDEYQLLKEQKNINLGGAILSPDKENLLYYECTLGDPSFSVLNMDTLNTFSIVRAMSAKWADNETIIGASYTGGAYLASVSGEISVVDDLKRESPVIVEKIKDYIYYNTNSDESLYRLDLSSKEKVSLNLSHVYDVLPSPNGDQILVVQGDGTKRTLALYDTDGSNRKLIAEGTEIEGVSWSPNQRMIAYNIKGDVNGLYIFDMLTGDSTQIAVDIQNVSTNWSSSGQKLGYTEWDEKQYDSSVVLLKY